ncbi:minor capsid protein [Lachnospiraceae bacterium 46-61]
MQNSEYWEKRFILLNEMLLQKGENYFKSAQKNYADVMENIEKDINDFYMKFAHENNITFQQAKQILTTSERQAFQMKLNEYIKYGSKNGLSKEWVKKLKNASTVHRVTRLQSLQYQFRQQVEKLEAIKEHGLTNTLKDIYKEGYYRTAYEIQRASGIGSAFSRIDERKIEKVLAKPWAADGKNFSERIWGQDRTQLLYQLENRFSQGMIRGESLQKIIKDIQKALNSSEYATRRLVMTESAFFASASRKETYNKLEVKQYKILAVLDTKTSTVCRDMDGKVFDVKDYQPGLNANPFHANCRTTTTPYFNDEFTQQQERSARDKDGKTYYVPANMTYKEWYSKYVKDNQNVSTKDNTVLKQQKQSINQSINNVESLHNQQMKQLQEMAQQQKQQLEQLQNVINQQKQQLYANNIEIFKMESTKQLEKLTDQQKQAIKEYTGNSAYEINRRIAKGKDLGKYKQQFDLLHTALSQCEITSDIIVQRKTILEHLNIPNEIVQQIKKNKNFIALLKNKIVVNKTFTSTSLIDFDYPPRNVIVKIKIPKGFKGGVYIKDIAYKKYQNQEEVLFDVGLIYKIVSVKIIDNKYYLEAEVIP